MPDDLWHHACQEELVQTERETEACPVMSILHNLQCVSFEVDLPIKVHFLECLQWDLVLAIVLGAITFPVECEVMLDPATGISGLLILAR